MGIGSYPCGTTLCGLDAAFTTDRRAVRPPTALVFDGVQRDFQLDTDGRYKQAHPVDAKVFLILRTVAGSIRSAVDVGQTVSAIEYIDPVNINATVQDRITVALAPTVAAAEISVENIDIDTAIRGRIMFRVDYVNLVTGSRQNIVFPT